jgi:hypothetical protein
MFSLSQLRRSKARRWHDVYRQQFRKMRLETLEDRALLAADFAGLSNYVGSHFLN